MKGHCRTSEVEVGPGSGRLGEGGGGCPRLEHGEGQGRYAEGAEGCCDRCKPAQGGLSQKMG
jgi:hypothetical protein